MKGVNLITFIRKQVDMRLM